MHQMRETPTKPTYQPAAYCVEPKTLNRTLHRCTCLQAQLVESESQLAEAHKAAATAAAEAHAARAALSANQQEQRGDVAALRQQLEAEVEKVGAFCRGCG
jgi:hypothetical protein